MSKYKLHGKVGKHVKAIEMDKGDYSISRVRAKFGQVCGYGVGLQFKHGGSSRSITTDDDIRQALSQAASAQIWTPEFILVRDGSSPMTVTDYKAAPRSTTKKTYSTPSPASSSSSSSSATAKKTSSPAPAASSGGASSGCFKCGAALPAIGARFCSSCGSQQPAGGTSSGGSSAPAPSQASAGSSGSGPDSCAVCGQGITTAGLKALGRAFHVACFTCGTCGTSLNGQSFTEHNGQPMCVPCYQAAHAEKCSGCGQAIEGSYFSVDEARYHPDCLRCARCNDKLQGGYLRTDDGPMCKACAQTIMS